MSGIIVCGYPGVGKSSIAGWKNCIDLESSLFSAGHYSNVPATYDMVDIRLPFDMYSDKEIRTIRVPDWVAVYCQTAMSLAEQGYIVLVSTHKDVVQLLSSIAKIPVVIFCPKLEWKDQWIERLTQRYKRSGDPKDFRALMRAREHYADDIQELLQNHLQIWQPDQIYYDLRNYISRMTFMNELSQYECVKGHG